MTKTIYSQHLQSDTSLFFILCLNHIHLIPLQLKTKSKCFHRSQQSSPWQTGRRAHLIQSSHYHVYRKGLPRTTSEETLLHYPPSQVTNPLWMEQNVKVSLGHTGLLLYLDIQWSAVRAVRSRFGDLHLAWWCMELWWGAAGPSPGCRCECSTGSCQQRGGISWSDADRGCLQAAGAQPDWHPVYSEMTSGLGMGVTGILIHLAMWKLPWNTVWWSLCRVHITRIIEEFQGAWAPSSLPPGCVRS